MFASLISRQHTKTMFVPKVWLFSISVLVCETFQTGIPIYLFEQKSQAISRKFSKNSMRIFKSFVAVFFIRFHRKGVYFEIPSTFGTFTDNVPKTFREIYHGYEIKLLLTNCSFHIENIRTLVFRSDVISFHPYLKTAL